MEPINKTMDRRDLERPEARAIVHELDALAVELRERGVRASTWYGHLDSPPEARAYERTNRGYRYRPLPGTADDARWPWFLYWEIAWLVLNTPFAAGQRVLDLGGSSSLFSYFLASRGLSVVAVDLKGILVTNGNFAAARMGWDLRNVVGDIRRLQPLGKFDHVTAMCVYEHVPVADRVEVSARTFESLRPGGTFGLTFDFRNPSPRACISTPRDIEEQIVRPSGLAVRGNRSFHDNGRRYLLHPIFHPRAIRHGWKKPEARDPGFPWRQAWRVKLRNDYTFGALFLEKPG